MSKNQPNSGGKPAAPQVDPIVPVAQDAPAPAPVEPVAVAPDSSKPIVASPEALTSDQPSPTVAQTPKQLGQEPDAPPKGDPKDAGPNNAEPVAEVVPGTDFQSAEFGHFKTSGDFNLLDPFTGTCFDANSDGDKALKSQFVIDNLESGRLVEA